MKTPEELVRPDILALKAYCVAEAKGMVKLDAMENPYRLPEPLRRKLSERLAAAEINRYPEPSGRELRELLARKMDVPAGMELLLGNGSDDLIQIVTFALAKPGATMMVPEPTFVVYRMHALLSGMKLVGVPLDPEFGLERDAFIAQVKTHRPALVFIAYPNNPTGVLYLEEDVAAIIRATDGVVVLDEAYHVFARKSFMARLAEFPNLVVMRTVSKLGLAGIRLGYLAARPQWVAQFNKVRQVYNVSVLTQVAAKFALEHLDVLQDQAAAIIAERAGLRESLAALPGVKVFPSEANFFLFRVADANRTFEGLCRQGVLVRNLHGAHPMLANCLRVTVGTPEENRILLNAMRESV